MRVYITAIVILVVAYAIQIVTPLRLHPDTVVLLSVAESAARGDGFVYHGQPTVFPPGYPAVVMFLIKIGLAHSSILIVLNLISLFIGFYALSYILQRRFFPDIFRVFNICAFSLLSFVFIRHFTIPLTDICFFGIAMSCIAVMESAWGSQLGSKLLWRLLASWLLVSIAISVRRIGLALTPALLYSTFGHPGIRLYLRRCPARVKSGGLAIACGGVGAIVWIIARTSTLKDFGSVLSGHGLFEAAWHILQIRLFELGEMTLNVPRFVLIEGLRSTLPFIGAVCLIVIVAGLTRQRRQGSTEVFFWSYSFLIFLWPYYDPRFWLPVLPLAIAYLALATAGMMRVRIGRVTAGVYCAAFAAMGLLALFSSTIVTFSGPDFPNLYSEPRYRSTYCAVYPSCGEGQQRDPVDQAALHVYRTYR